MKKAGRSTDAAMAVRETRTTTAVLLQHAIKERN